MQRGKWKKSWPGVFLALGEYITLDEIGEYITLDEIGEFQRNGQKLETKEVPVLTYTHKIHITDGSQTTERR